MSAVFFTILLPPKNGRIAQSMLMELHCCRNHRFAKEYNMTVPDTWHVINARYLTSSSQSILCRM